MASLPASSIDAIIADPPYLTTNLHFDKVGLDWQAWWAEAWRVVKPAGVVVLFAADLFTVDLILTQRQNYRYRLVWEKSSATGFLSAEKRPLKAHEDILIFGKNGSESTYNPQKQARTGKPQNRTNLTHNGAAHYGGSTQSEYVDDGSRYPRSVVCFGSVAKWQTEHPTEKPVDLLRWLVRTYTNEGDTVLDCFMGSGSTGAACLHEDRNFIGCELHEEYFTKAKARLDAIASAPTLFAA